MVGDTYGSGVSLCDRGGVPYPPNKKTFGKGKGPRVPPRGPCGIPGVGAPDPVAEDLSREGLDVQQSTRTLRQTHTKAPAVAAMTRTSLRLEAFDVFPRQPGCGCTSAPEGGEMS